MVTLQPPHVRPPRRPDESMSLLNDLFAKPLDPGYEEAAARRREAGKPVSAALRFSPALTFGLLALGLLLTMAALQVRDTASVVSEERQELLERIRSEDDRVTALQQTAASLESEIDDLEDALLQNSSIGQQLRDEVEALQASSGAIAVSGPGVVVSIDDADDPENAEDPDLARVLDIDLQQVVNGLWAAGAEAVSINGERVTALTAIRQAEKVVRVNYRPMSAPFEIVAIGDSRSLPGRFGDGSGGQWLRLVASDNGLESGVRTEDSLTVPAGNIPLVHAIPGEVT